MVNNPKISIIVPVYKVEKYLRQCVDSILGQTFEDWECILIDDGSPDDSGSICDEYAQKDSRFRVIHKENGGVSSARNVGISQMKGEFVCFFDADDELYNHSLAVLSEAITGNVGSSVGGFVHFDESGFSSFKYIEEAKQVILDEAIIDFYNPNCHKDWQRYLWNRMFRTSVIKKHHLKFREDIYFKEDGLFLIQYLTACKQDVAYVNSVVYKYRLNSISATASIRNGYNPKILTNVIAHCEIVSAILKYTSDDKLCTLSRLGMYNGFKWVEANVKPYVSSYRSFIKPYRDILIRSIGHKLYFTLQCKEMVKAVLRVPIVVLRKINIRK